MSFTPSHIATLATRAAIDDLRILLKSLEFWNTIPPTVYIFCDSEVTKILPSIAYKGVIVTNECLNEYTGLNRAAMEQMPGKKYANLFFDFVCEKLNLLEWVFSTTKTTGGILFCDADICFLAPMFKIPEDSLLAVSPHLIRVADEAKYGVYNAGMLWVKNTDIVGLWREACSTSSFYEQVAIEDVVNALNNVYTIPSTENYGWWRLWQGRSPPEELQKQWGMNRNKPGSGITVIGAPLGSVHTHFGERRDSATVAYNEYVLGWLRKIAKVHPNTQKFMKHMGFK